MNNPIKNNASLSGSGDGLIAVVPYSERYHRSLAEMPLSDLVWPLGEPDELPGETVADLRPQDHLVLYPRLAVFGRRVAGIRAQFSILFVEPFSFHFYQMWLTRLFKRRFFRILTSNPTLLASCPNAEKFVPGGTWVTGWQDRDCQKTKMVSLIASRKKSLKGHKLRHRIADWIRQNGIEADLMGRGYRAFEDKAEGLAPYRYSVVIENSRESGYFTEKIIDALLLETVPIYWGAPDIGEYFDTTGMLVCQSEADIQQAVRSLTEADYQSRFDAIQRNKRIAAHYADYELAAVSAVRKAATGL